ncbi:MAG: hypothetical protein JWN99_554 [Ilumatobacteraceae bacterium]|nr:hypothetical protein [Ilumatobacteraceae bacterium]
MSLEADNKRVALSWFDYMSKRDLPGVMSILTEDYEHFIPGELPISGRHRDRDQFYVKFADMWRGQFAEPIAFEIGTVTAEGDHVAIEAQGTAPLTGGGQFQCQYHFLFRIRSGRIALIKGYFDTQHVARVIASPYTQGPPKLIESNIF